MNGYLKIFRDRTERRQIERTLKQRAEELRLLVRELGIPVRLRADAPGSLSVLVNGERVFSNKQAGRSTAPAEIIKILRERAIQ